MLFEVDSFQDQCTDHTHTNILAMRLTSDFHVCGCVVDSSPRKRDQSEPRRMTECTHDPNKLNHSSLKNWLVYPCQNL